MDIYLKLFEVLFPVFCIVGIGIFLGKIVSPTVMGLIFFLVLTPTGIFMRIIKKNFLNLKFDDSKSYWIKKDLIRMIEAE